MLIGDTYYYAGKTTGCVATMTAASLLNYVVTELITAEM